MGYGKQEQETTLIYEAETNEWSVYSTVPTHIRKLMSIGEMTVIETEDDRPIAIKGKLSKKQVSMKQERVISEEQRARMSEMMKQRMGK